VTSLFRIFGALVAGGLALSAVPSAPATAHTEVDLVAVPAGSDATVTLRPTHGCDDSPTVEVAIRAPVPGATAGAVDGWTATATPDGTGRTVLTWTDGSLPATATGAFPVTFTAPDTPGTLLTFPAVQRCDNGAELAWISGDPAAENPAPRLLILPAGSEPAATIDDVAPDAPGRDQLVAIVDVDNPNATTTAPPTTAADPSVVAPSTAPEDAAPEDAAGDGSGDDSDDDDSSSGALPIVFGAVAVLAAGGAFVLWRQRRG
jgi:uncharacterized protein YcnI